MEINNKYWKCHNAGKCYKFSLLFPALLSLMVPAYAYETHKFSVEPVEFLVYPGEYSLINRHRSSLHYIVADLQSGVLNGLDEFARIALFEMAALYEEIALGTSEDKKIEINEGAKLYRWRKSTLVYADSLYQVSESVLPATSIELFSEPTGELYIFLDGRPYVISNPLLKENTILDNRIINRFCHERICPIENIDTENYTERKTITIRSNWVISSDLPEFVTDDGLHFIFNDINDRARKQTACLKVLKEIKWLSDTLKGAKKNGLYIDWDYLRISPLYGSYDYRIQINPFGDSVYMKFPALHAIREWQDQLLPWLRAQVEERQYQKYFRADEVLARGMK